MSVQPDTTKLFDPLVPESEPALQLQDEVITELHVRVNAEVLY